MKKIECFVQPFDFEEIAGSMVAAGVLGMSVTEVKGFGVQRGFRLGEAMKSGDFVFHPKIKIEVVVEDADVDRLIEACKTSIKSHQIGEGKIFVTPVEDAVRARTGEHGEAALV
ncbi:MAG TPA: P-II family nitrogen regulator [Actinomycetota bacterium]|nr:P-II family nitrogen regulator [Actinomycetota bacterium]